MLARAQTLALSLLLLAGCPSPPPSAPPAPSTGSAAAAPSASSELPAASASATAAAPTAGSSASAAPPDVPPPAEPTEAALPPGFVRLPEDEETTCGGYRISWPKEPKWGELRYVKVVGPSGARVYEAHGQETKLGPEPDAERWHNTLYGDFCGDLTGDGVVELVMTESSMGAHCCYTHYVVSLSDKPKRLLMWERGDAGLPILPVKLMAGRSWQLKAWVVFWPPFDGEKGDPVLSYASAPVIPAVLVYLGGEYKLASLSFPDVYREDREDNAKRCAEQGADCPTELFSLFDWVDAVAIGDWPEWRKKISDPKSLQDVPALDRRTQATRHQLEKTLGSLKAPVVTTPKALRK